MAGRMKANTPPAQNLIVKSVSLVAQFVGPGDGKPPLLESSDATNSKS
jgi:hypothetical protein